MFNTLSTSRKILVTLLAVLLLGAGLRVYKLDAVSFSADEFLDINATYGYAKTGMWQAWDFNFQLPAERVNKASDERAWPYRWQVAHVLKYVAPTEAVARSVSVLWGIIAILVTFFVAKDFTGSKTIALISSFLFAVSPMAIEIDRTLRMYAMFGPIFLLFCWALFRFLEPRKSDVINLSPFFSFPLRFDFRFLPCVLFFGWLSFAVHQLSANILFGVAGYILFWSIFLFSKKQLFTTYSFLAALGTLVFLVFWILYPNSVRLALGQLVFFDDHWSYLAKVFGDFSHGIAAFFLVVAGSWFLWEDHKRKEAIWIISFLVTILLAAILLWKRNVGVQYIFFVQPFAVILVSSGLVHAARFLARRFACSRRVFVMSVLMGLILIPNYAYFAQEDNAYRQTSRSESPNYRSVFAYFLKHKQEGDALITRDFRNYYFHDARVDVYDFGGELSERNFSLTDLLAIQSKHTRGWVVYSDNDAKYMSKEARTYIEDNLIKARDPLVRGGVFVYYWE